MTVPTWLPNELAHTMLQECEGRLLSHDSYDKDTLDHLKFVADKMGVASSSILGLGLWMDAAPFNRDRSQPLRDN